MNSSTLSIWEKTGKIGKIVEKKQATAYKIARLCGKAYSFPVGVFTLSGFSRHQQSKPMLKGSLNSATNLSFVRPPPGEKGSEDP
jgi:hypothetical protein